MSLEAYFAQTQNLKKTICFKTCGGGVRNFQVCTQEANYGFPWMQVTYSTLSTDETELSIYLSQHVIDVVGRELKPLHDAIVHETLEFMKALPLGNLIDSESKGALIASITVYKAPPPNLPVPPKALASLKKTQAAK